jgi:hypothetical protein
MTRIILTDERLREFGTNTDTFYTVEEHGSFRLITHAFGFKRVHETLDKIQSELPARFILLTSYPSQRPILVDYTKIASEVWIPMSTELYLDRDASSIRVYECRREIDALIRAAEKPEENADFRKGFAPKNMGISGNVISE